MAITKNLTHFKSWLRLYDGYNKPKINFQDMYKLFPMLEFTAINDFGNYSNFGKAFERKNYNMIVSDGTKSIMMIYGEYGDANENITYTA